MPNYVYSGFHVTGEREEIDRFAKLMFKTVPTVETEYTKPLRPFETIMDFGAIIPPPDSMKNGIHEWWAVENWGTKWTGFDVDVWDYPDGSLHFQFTTAWDFPTPVLEAIAAEFPALVFDGSAYEEDNAFQYTGQFNGDNSWGPGQIEFITI
ncbi:hypothetical protein [Citromicrobium bathyomarinum]|uniref:DUF1281 family ferredoxin-like fold protein n=1 Tax=Citromicrobium bathyomarinum TaxID=72174 RepID=UPI00315A738C